MKRFTDSGRKALEGENLYAALSLALTLPDICGSIEDPGPGKSKKRYEAWYKRWLEATYTSPASRLTPAKIFLTAADCFQLRCSLIHSGSAEIEPRKAGDIESFIFFDDTMKAHCNYSGGNRVNGVLQPNFLQLNTRRFSLDVFDAVDKWDASIAHNNAIQAEKAKLLLIHSAGKTVGGITFG